MHVKDVWIDNAVLQADEGIDVQEATNINFSNITMISKNIKPVAYLLNSDKITIDRLKFADSAEVLLQMQGERTKDIQLLNSDVTKAKQKLVADFGATEGMVTWAAPAPPAEVKKKNKASRKGGKESQRR